MYLYLKRSIFEFKNKLFLSGAKKKNAKLLSRQSEKSSACTRTQIATKDSRTFIQVIVKQPATTMKFEKQNILGHVREVSS